MKHAILYYSWESETWRQGQDIGSNGSSLTWGLTRLWLRINPLKRALHEIDVMINSRCLRFWYKRKTKASKQKEIEEVKWRRSHDPTMLGFSAHLNSVFLQVPAIVNSAYEVIHKAEKMNFKSGNAQTTHHWAHPCTRASCGPSTLIHPPIGGSRMIQQWISIRLSHGDTVLGSDPRRSFYSSRSLGPFVPLPY